MSFSVQRVSLYVSSEFIAQFFVMAAFFDISRQKMFDVKKRLGLSDKENETAEVGSQAESWVELAPSRQSLCSSVDATMCMLDDRDKDSRLSPVSVTSPHIEFESLEAVKYRLVRDMLPPGKNTDWIWDWSSRPEAIPSKSLRMRQYGSNLTTPPNSPEPELLSHFPSYDSDIGRISSLNLMLGMIVSNIVTFVIGAAIGFVVCKRLGKKDAY